MKSLIVAFLFILIPAITFAQKTLFQKEYDLFSSSAFRVRGNIIHTNNNGYALNCIPNGQSTISLTKTNSNGDIEWTALYSDGLNTFLGCFVTLAEDGFLISGSVFRLSDNRSAILIKTDPYGNIQWTSKNSYLNKNVGAVNVMADNNGYYLPGQIWDQAVLSTDFFLSRFDKQGNHLWTKTYDSGADDWLFYAVLCDDGSVLLAGSSSFSSIKYTYLVKTDLNGNVIWSRKFPSIQGADPLYVMQNNKGNYVLTGRTFSFGAGLWDIFLMEIANNGDFLWGKSFGGIRHDEGYSVLQTKDNGYIICAEPESFYHQPHSAFIKTDDKGNFQWMKIYGDTLIGSFPFGALLNNDNTLALFGINGTNEKAAPICLLKTDSNGNSGCLEKDVVPLSGPFLLDVDSGCFTNTINAGNDYGVIMEKINLNTTIYCSDTIEYKKQVIDDTLFIPNIFTPNRDGQNESFSVKYNGNEKFHIKIFNRWGEIVFYSEDKNLSWDGKVKNGEAPEGTYFYILLIGDQKYTGYLILIK